MVDLAQIEQWVHWLWSLKNGRKSTIVFGDAWGDGGKRAVESTIEHMFDVFVRVSGGANTGGTRWIPDQTGTLRQMVFHLIPSCWPFKRAVIGDWVLFNLARFIDEKRRLIEIAGTSKADLHISRLAPLVLPYYGLLEASSESMLGSAAIGTTKRGIANTIAAIDLRQGPTVGYLLYPTLLFEWIERFFKQHEVELRAYEEMCRGTKSEFDLDKQYGPHRVTDELLAMVPEVQEFITDTGPILLQLMSDNAPILFGMSQGFGLTRIGTYPYCSSTQTSAAAAAYCGSLPMADFGPIIQVSKLIPTRVGYGPFPTGWWHRLAAEKFPIDYPYLFSELDDHYPERRAAFIKARRELINSGAFVNEDLALLMQVLLNNLGATTRRGREPGGPDLHQAACAAAVNGSDVIALTQADVLEGLKLDFPFGTEYWFDGERVPVPVMPFPVEKYDDPSFKVMFEHIPVDLVGVDLFGKSELPDVFDRIRALYAQQTGAPIGLISTSPKGDEGKVFFQEPAS